LAPSHQLRLTLGMTRTSHLRFPTAFALALLLGLTVTLSACGGAQEAGAAAIVNGKVIRDDDVQTVADQISALGQGGQKLSPGDALLNLILAPFVLAEAGRAGKTVSDSEVRKVVASALPDPSPATIEFLEMQNALSQLDQTSKGAVLKALGSAKITVNPRYGTFDPAQGSLAPNSPNWIKPSATSPAS
jgi:hypothetical protein